MLCPATDGDKAIGGEALSRLLRRRIKFLLQPGTKVLGVLRKVEVGVGFRPFSLPARGIIHQIGKGDMAPACWKEDIARAQPIPHRDGES